MPALPPDETGVENEFSAEGATRGADDFFFEQAAGMSDLFPVNIDVDIDSEFTMEEGVARVVAFPRELAKWIVELNQDAAGTIPPGRVDPRVAAAHLWGAEGAARNEQGSPELSDPPRMNRVNPRSSFASAEMASVFSKVLPGAALEPPAALGPVISEQPHPRGTTAPNPVRARPEPGLAERAANLSPPVLFPGQATEPTGKLQELITTSTPAREPAPPPGDGKPQPRHSTPGRAAVAFAAKLTQSLPPEARGSGLSQTEIAAQTRPAAQTRAGFRIQAAAEQGPAPPVVRPQVVEQPERIVQPRQPVRAHPGLRTQAAAEQGSASPVVRPQAGGRSGEQPRAAEEATPPGGNGREAQANPRERSVAEPPDVSIHAEHGIRAKPKSALNNSGSQGPATHALGSATPEPATAVKRAGAETASGGGRDADPTMIRRAAEPDAAVRASGTAREINLKLGTSKANGVDVQVVERGGKVHVAVRTSDTELASSLRGDLGSLLTRVEHRGYRAEIWTPLDTAFQSLASHKGSGAGSAAQFDDSPRGGNGSAGEQAGDQPRHQPDQPAWLEELEGSFGGTTIPGMEGMEWFQLLRH